MGRQPTILQSEFPYNISARSINKDWFTIPMDEVWAIFGEELKKACENFEFKIHLFVLMSNHFHLIASTPQSNLSQCMHQFMGNTSRRLAKSGNRINETFAGRYFKGILQHQNYYLNAYKYNYRNPVAAGACEKVEDYPYSSLQSVLGHKEGHFPLVEDTTYLFDPVGTLEWLNETPDPIKLEAVRFGLRKQFFTSKKDSIRNRPILKEFDLL